MNKQSTKFGYIPVGSILTDRALNGLITDYIPGLENIGGWRFGPEAIADPLPLFYFIVTGGTEQKILDLRKKRKKRFPREPVFLLTHPGNNSLPAALEVLARLQQDGQQGRIFFLKSPRDNAGLQEIARAVLDLKAFHALQQSRIGLVGDPSDWLVASSPDPEIVRTVWGPEVVPVDFDELKQYLADVPDEEIASILDSLIPNSIEVREPSVAELKEAVGVYLALKKLIGTYRLDAVTVRCFDLVTEQSTTACLALAQLNDENIVAGCEGDLVSTVSLLWIKTLLNHKAWMANPARIDVKNNSLWLAHCTIPRGMVENYRLRSHFESGLGVALQGRLPTGPATLLRIGGRALDRIWLAEGEIVGSGDAENLCRTQTRVHLTERDLVEELLKAPLGNHLLLVPGHHAGRLRGWWELMIDRHQGGSVSIEQTSWSSHRSC